MKTTHKRGRKPFTLPEGAKVDWSLTNKEIGKEYGVSPMQILLLRRRMGIDPLPRGRPFDAKTQNHENNGNLKTQVQIDIKPVVNELVQNALNLALKEIKKQLNLKG